MARDKGKGQQTSPANVTVSNGVDAMTNSVLVNSMLVKREEHIVIPMAALKGFESDHLLFMYIKSKKILQVIGVKDADKGSIVNLTMYSLAGDLMRFSITMTIEIFQKRGVELLWTSGICTPDEESRTRLGIPRDEMEGCIWEGLLKLPEGLDPAGLKENITRIDSGRILKTIDIKTVERIGYGNRDPSANQKN